MMFILYYYHAAGYGIFLDKEYNVEYGYYTTEAPPTGHGAGYTTFHDFKDSRENDFIGDKLIECIILLIFGNKFLWIKCYCWDYFWR